MRQKKSAVESEREFVVNIELRIHSMGNFVVTRSFVYANCTHVHKDESNSHGFCVFILDLIDKKKKKTFD